MNVPECLKELPPDLLKVINEIWLEDRSFGIKNDECMYGFLWQGRLFIARMPAKPFFMRFVQQNRGAFQLIVGPREGAQALITTTVVATPEAIGQTAARQRLAASRMVEDWATMQQSAGNITEFDVKQIVDAVKNMPLEVI